MKRKSPGKRTHGESHTRLHNLWCGINNRCDPNHKNSKEYGKRGISVCEEWTSYESFSKWARENGYQDGYTIERIDVNGDYCPENCMWIPLSKQARNRRTTHWVEYNGKRMSLAEACETANMPYKQVFERISKRGWPFEKAISTPMGATVGKTDYNHCCLICGNEFVSHSSKSKYCSRKCFNKHRFMERHGIINFCEK